MSYTDDAVRAKLSALNETQESIVTVAQWVMFHRRYADRTAQLWLQRLADSTSIKKLNLIYLANEVVQQFKARKKDDFHIAFSPIISEAMAIAAKNATNEILQKLRRVVEVWRQRQIFESAIQDAVEARLDEVDKSQSRVPVKKPLLGGSLFSDLTSTTPPELQPLVPLHQAVSKAFIVIQPLITKADAEFFALNDESQPIPTPPVHAARLSSLIKSLANAEDAVAESLKTQRILIASLEKLLEVNNMELTATEAQHLKLCSRKESMTQKRYEVEDDIMRGLSSKDLKQHLGSNRETDNAPDGAASMLQTEDAERPEMERFTPPPVESTTPPGVPPQALPQDDTNELARPEYEEITPPPAHSSTLLVAAHSGAATTSVLSPSVAAAADPRRRQRPSMSSPANGIGSIKKRKLSEHEDELGDGTDAMAGLDADVVGMLG